MPEALSKHERLQRTISGRPVDRLPVALWRHFFVEEVTRKGLVDAMVGWQQTYDWDFLKINPRACYHVQDWGNQYEFSEREHIKPTLVRTSVHEPDDFRHLDRLSVDGSAGRKAPVLAEHLAAVADIRKGLGPDVPLLMTVFTPMSIAAELAGGPQDLAHLIEQDPATVHAGLRTVTDTFADFGAACIDAGAEGVFLATTHVGTLTNFTLEQYEEFGRPYDLEVLDAVRGAPFNLLHVCRSKALVRELADYPVAMLNWDMMDETNPDLAEMVPLAEGKALVGGLAREPFNDSGAAESLREQLREARRDMGERPFVVGSTCTIDTTAEPDVVAAVREAVEDESAAGA